jgi:hypothetical protein
MPQKTNTKNYLDRVKLIKKDNIFFTGDYAGSFVGKCFPPIANPECREDGHYGPYSNLEKIEAESYYINLSDYHSIIAGEQLVDLAYFVSAELCKQRKYKYFTILQTSDIAHCSTTYSANSYSTSMYNAYPAKTYIDKKLLCSELYTLNILIFNHPEDLARGVLFTNEDDLNRMSFLRQYPFLYLGEKAKVYYQEFNDEDKYEEQDGRIYSNKVFFKRNAWKEYYMATEMGDAMIKKYNIGTVHDLKIQYEIDLNKKRKQEQEDDPKNKLKISQ